MNWHRLIFRLYSNYSFVLQHFIRNSYVNQKDVSDELCFDLFDLLHDNYEEFKTGNYSKSNNNVDPAGGPSTAKLSINKKKKLRRAAAKNDSNNSTPVKKEPVEEKWEKTKSKKKRKPKVPSDSSEDMETDE